MDCDKRIDPVEKALQATGNMNDIQSTADALKVYDSWTTYDEALTALQYKGPKVVADALVKYLPDNKDVRVLDVAAGSGLVGEELKVHGFKDIDGLDGSEGMLNLARQKRVYRNYIHELFPCEKTSVKESSYDVIVVSGGMSKNCMGIDCLPEIVRCVKTGGLVVITTRRKNMEDFVDKLESLMKQLETEGRWQILERTVIPNWYHTNQGLVFVLKVTKENN